MSQQQLAEVPVNGELLLAYWKRVGGQFEGGFLDKARQAAELHGFYYERGRLHCPPHVGGMVQ